MFLASCDTSQTSRQGSSTRVFGDGIELSFVQGVPPDIIHVERGLNPNTNFEVAVNIRNRGSFPRDDITSLNGRIYLRGFDSNIISGYWSGGNQFNSLRGASESMPEGSLLQKNFIANQINYPFESREYPINLLLTACYYYQTETAGIVCVDPNPTSREEKICTMGDVRLDVQNAPVKVTRVSQTATSSELIFNIEITNTGNGVVLREFAFRGGGVVTEDRCLNADTYRDMNLVGISTSIVGLGEGNCRPTGSSQEPIRLFDNRGNVVCTFPIPQNMDSAYTTQMQIILMYGYRQSVQKEIKLVNVGAR